MKQRRVAATVLALGAWTLSCAVQAEPITVDFAGYFLDNIGSNTLEVAGGGDPNGRPTVLFIGHTTPGPAAGTMAAAFQNGALVGGLATTPNTTGTLDWARRVQFPGPGHVTPLTVAFVNGTDSAAVVTRDLTGLTQMPLVTGLALDASADAFRPTLSWALPANAGDIDFVSLVFYSNVSNAEIGTRVTLPATATSFAFGSALPAGLDLTINVRLVDLYNDALPFTTDNIQRMSRSYINYTVPVPEPATWATLALGLGLGLVGGVAARRRTA